MAKKSIVYTAITGGGSLLLAVGTQTMIESLPDWVSPAAGILGIALLLVAAWLKWGKWDGADDDATPANTATSRDGSVAVAGQIRDVHIHNTPSPTVPERKPTPPPQTIYPPPTRLRPDLRLEELIPRIYERFGGLPSNAFERPAFDRRVDLEILDGFTLYDLHAWGRTFSFGIREIPRSQLREAYLDHLKGTLTIAGDFPNSSLEYTDLQFNRGEVDSIWPPKKAKDGKEGR